MAPNLATMQSSPCQGTPISASVRREQLGVGVTPGGCSGASALARRLEEGGGGWMASGAISGRSIGGKQRVRHDIGRPCLVFVKTPATPVNEPKRQFWVGERPQDIGRVRDVEPGPEAESFLQ